MNKPYFNNLFLSDLQSKNTKIELSTFSIADYQLEIKREDEIDQMVSGNKFRKLKYNLQQAVRLKKKVLVTFGGAYSNHIAAVASTGRQCGFETVGIIRGKELEDGFVGNQTLQYAMAMGMRFIFVTRENYRLREKKSFQQHILKDIEDYFLIPEGGTNRLAVDGCSEILNEIDQKFDYICVPVGTGGTMAGLVISAAPHQKVIGFSALKGTFQKDIVADYSKKENYEIIDSYCFGGYAKIDSELIRFMNNFYAETAIKLDPVYTGKMIYGIFDLMKHGYFKRNSRILAIHTGGLQGIDGMNRVLKKKNLPQIDY